MVENMFFLDSKYLGMVGMPAPHPPPPHPNKKYISIDRGKQFHVGESLQFQRVSLYL